MRALALAVLLLCPLGLFAQKDAPPTAQQVIDRVIADMGVALPTGTVDTYKAGDPNTPVTGIATTFLPTMSVLRRAVAQHLNLILTHEPTFYNHEDKTDFLADDPVYAEKLAYIREHHLVIFRLHDSMHRAKPDRIFQPFIEARGWEAYQDAQQPRLLTVPATTVGDLVAKLARVLDDPAIRVVGDPSLRVRRVALSLGAGGEAKHLAALEQPDVEALIVGEAHEWETVEYVRDAALQGRHKALILLGHDASEELGMKPFAARVQQLFPALPVKFVAAGEPYWTEGHPRPVQ